MDPNDIIPPHLRPSKKDWEAADENLEIIVYTRGYTPDDGIPFWAYVGVPPSKLISLKTADLSGENPLANYGRIIKAGVGEAPPPEIRKEMEETYQVNHTLENEIVETAKQIEKRESLINKYTKKKGENDDKPN